jgi:pyruvate kinase
MKKRTKIVATLGPASDSYEKIRSLMKAGVNVFRLNFSHGTHAYHSEVLGRIRKAIEETGLITGILQDISGPKIRVGMLEEDFTLKSGDILEFVKEQIVGRKVSEGVYRLSLNTPQILDQLKVGDAIYLYDGIIRAVVKEKTKSVVRVEIENEGMLSSRKGVNFPNTHLGIDVLTQKDRDDIRWGVENGVDFMAISFVQHAKDMKAAREIVEMYDGNVHLLAKIEKFDAVENIDAILEESDGIMVARGDLGIEIPYYEVPLTQKMLIEKANDASKPVIVATQMLLSMTTKESASRAEISDVANAVLDGADAVMLSEESAIGHYPLLAVETMVKTIQATEKRYPYHKFDHFVMHDRADKIDESAVRLSESLETSGIIAMTASGASARKAARYRPSRPIYAVTHDRPTAQRLTLVWGVVPAFLVAENGLREMMAEVMADGLKRQVLDTQSSYILVAGDPVGVPGSTNLLRVISRYEMEFFASLKD